MVSSPPLLSPTTTYLNTVKRSPIHKPKTPVKKPRYPLKDACRDAWTWNHCDKSHEVKLSGDKNEVAHFHPNWSNGTAGVRGTKPLNFGVHYWEIDVSQRIFGTSMMFGIGTRRTRLHVDAFLNMLGEDEHSWGLNHKGMIWHNNRWDMFTKPFKENEATTVGLLFDWFKGTLTYYKDGECLGVAYSNLNKVEEDIYPMICSTAAKTEMSLGVALRGYGDLQDRCRGVILAQMGARVENNPHLEGLPLPTKIVAYLRQGIL